MRLNELSFPDEMEGAEPILKGAGWDMLGDGYFGAVYGKDGTDYVLKLFDNRDKAYRAFVALVQAHPNKHFPKFKGKLIQITGHYWAIRMEKLIPALKKPSLGVYLMCRDSGPNPRNDLQVQAYNDVIEYLKDHPELKVALDLIIDNLLPKFMEDLHYQNIMQRADGTLVIIDPVR